MRLIETIATGLFVVLMDLLDALVACAVGGTILGLRLVDIRPMSPRKLKWHAQLSDWWQGFADPLVAHSMVVGMSVGRKDLVAVMKFPGHPYVVAVVPRVRVLWIPTPWWQFRTTDRFSSDCITEAMAMYMSFVSKCGDKS